MNSFSVVVFRSSVRPSVPSVPSIVAVRPSVRPSRPFDRPVVAVRRLPSVGPPLPRRVARVVWAPPVALLGLSWRPSGPRWFRARCARVVLVAV